MVTSYTRDELIALCLYDVTHARDTRKSILAISVARVWRYRNLIITITITISSGSQRTNVDKTGGKPGVLQQAVLTTMVYQRRRRIDTRVVRRESLLFVSDC